MPDPPQETAAKKEGFSVPLSHAEGFVGKVLSDDPGWNENKGECATGVQYVFYKAGNPLGKTSGWTQGVKVRGNKIPAGTAIASFQNGRFAQDHAAILIRETKQGLEVYDQYNHPAKAWGKRTLYFNGKPNDRANSGDLFYVVQK